MPHVDKPNKGCFRKQTQFMAWLRNKYAITKIDFGKYFKGKCKISNNKMILKAVRIENHRAKNEDNSRTI